MLTDTQVNNWKLYSKRLFANDNEIVAPTKAFVKFLHLKNRTADKIYAVQVDYIGGETPYLVTASWGRTEAERAQSSQNKGSFSTLEEAIETMQDLLSKKWSKGYRDIESPQYRTRLTVASLSSKIDLSRVVVTNLTQIEPVKKTFRRIDLD